MENQPEKIPMIYLYWPLFWLILIGGCNTYTSYGLLRILYISFTGPLETTGDIVICILLAIIIVFSLPVLTISTLYRVQGFITSVQKIKKDLSELTKKENTYF